MAREVRPQTGSNKPGATKGSSDKTAPEPEPQPDPSDPVENTPSDLDDLTHAEFIEIYRDASANIRFAKEQMWRTLLYFSFGAVAVVAYGEFTAWAEPTIIRYLLATVWIFSVASALIILSLQWWQAAEHRKIDYVTGKWSTFATAARSRKSPRMSDVQRYGMLVAMILYLELVTIAVTGIFLEYL